MYVETWADFLKVYRNIRPLASPADKRKIDNTISWAKKTRPATTGIDQSVINIVDAFTLTIRKYASGEGFTDLNKAVTFLRWLNVGATPPELFTQTGCGLWGFYWWDNDCHDKPRPKPVLKVCSDHTNKSDCEAANCYWWDNACHSHGKPEPKPPPPPPPVCRDHKTKAACEAAGCFWWLNACYDSPEPEPPPVCEDYLTETKCLAEGCYWYDGTCHLNPKVVPIEPTDPIAELSKEIWEYCITIPLTKPLEKVSCNALALTLKVLSDFFTWQRRR